MNYKLGTSEDFTIKTKSGEDIIFPDKTGTVALVDDGYNRVPLLEKTFDPYTCSANSEAKGNLALMKVHPTSDNWVIPWHVHYRLWVTTSNDNAQSYHDCYVSQCASQLPIAWWNQLYSSSYYTITTHMVWWHNSAAKYANRSTYPVRIGVKVYNAYSVTSLARVYKIQVLEASGCTVEINDTLETRDSFYSSNYYTETIGNATSTGLQETGDNNTLPYMLYDYGASYLIHSTSTPLYRYKICGFDAQTRLLPISLTNQTSGTVVNQTPCGEPMIVSKGLVFYNTTTNITTSTSRTASNTIYRYVGPGATWHLYNFSSMPTPYNDVYLKGFYNAVTDEFTLDTSSSTSYYVFVPHGNDGSNIFESGYYYWYVGYVSDTVYSGSIYYADFTLEHPLFYYDGEKLLPANQNSVNTETPYDNTVFTKKQSLTPTNGEALIKSIKGNSIVWNQLVSNGDFSNGTTGWGGLYATISVSNNSLVIEPTSANGGAQKVVSFIDGHKYYLAFDVKCSEDGTLMLYIGGSTVLYSDKPVTTSWSRDSRIFTYASSYGDYIWWRCSLNKTYYLDNVILIDLTKMFGALNEPATVEDFEKLYPNEYYQYDAGNIIVNNNTTAIKSYDRDNNLVDTGNLPDLSELTAGGTALSTIFPNGLCSARDVYDEINETKAIKRVGRVDLGTLTWSYGSSMFYSTSITNAKGSNAKLLCPKYNNGTTNGCAYFVNGPILRILDSSYTDPATFKTAMSGVYLNYELATPVEYTLDNTWETKYSYRSLGFEEQQPVFSNPPTTAPFRGDMVYSSISLQEQIDELNAGNKLFVAIYNVTTFEEIVSAVESGKVVVCTRNTMGGVGTVTPMTSYYNDDEDNFVEFSGYDSDNERLYYYFLSSDSSWRTIAKSISLLDSSIATQSQIDALFQEAGPSPSSS